MPAHIVSDEREQNHITLGVVKLTEGLSKFEKFLDEPEKAVKVKKKKKKVVLPSTPEEEPVQ